MQATPAPRPRTRDRRRTSSNGPAPSATAASPRAGDGRALGPLMMPCAPDSPRFIGTGPGAVSCQRRPSIAPRSSFPAVAASGSSSPWPPWDSSTRPSASSSCWSTKRVRGRSRPLPSRTQAVLRGCSPRTPQPPGRAHSSMLGPIPRHLLFCVPRDSPSLPPAETPPRRRQRTRRSTATASCSQRGRRCRGRSWRRSAPSLPRRARPPPSALNPPPPSFSPRRQPLPSLSARGPCRTTSGSVRTQSETTRGRRWA